MNLSKIAKNKSEKIQSLIHEGAKIIDSVGVPIDDLTPRRIEKMSMSFLALCAITKLNTWESTLSLADNHILRTREIITFINSHFEENISSGSYDDIRRKDLVRLVGMGLVVKSANNPTADTNDGTRGYAIDENFAKLIRTFGKAQWKSALSKFAVDTNYINSFIGKRKTNKVSISRQSREL